MKYSDKLSGFWEEGYHYYLEFRDKRLTVRDYRRAVALETTVKYDADAIERGERAVISLADNVLSRTASGEPFTMIRELAWENGELKLLYYYTIMGETLYTLRKVDHGPFDHIVIRDDEYLDRLQGEWIEWRADGERSSKLTIRRDRLSWFDGEVHPFHVVSYKTSPDVVRIVPRRPHAERFFGLHGDRRAPRYADDVYDRVRRVDADDGVRPRGYDRPDRRAGCGEASRAKYDGRQTYGGRAADDEKDGRIGPDCAFGRCVRC